MINCPGCGELTSTIYAARNLPEGRKRYLRCKKCGHHWLTMEINHDEYNKLLEGNGLSVLKDEIDALKEIRFKLIEENLRVREENLQLREKLASAKKTGVTWT